MGRDTPPGHKPTDFSPPPEFKDKSLRVADFKNIFSRSSNNGIIIESGEGGKSTLDFGQV